MAVLCQGPRAPWGSWVWIYAQLATSVRPLASCSSASCSASGRQRSLSLQSQCSMHPQRREVHSCGRGYANACQRLSTFSGHAKVLLTAARLVARAHIRGPGQPPLKSPIPVSSLCTAPRQVCMRNSLTPARASVQHAGSLVQSVPYRDSVWLCHMLPAILKHRPLSLLAVSCPTRVISPPQTCKRFVPRGIGACTSLLTLSGFLKQAAPFVISRTRGQEASVNMVNYLSPSIWLLKTGWLYSLDFHYLYILHNAK